MVGRASGVLVVVCWALDSLALPPVIRTSKGLVRGDQLGGLTTFYSLPYARPPVGSLRFRPPVEALPWGDTLDASRIPAHFKCPQMSLVSGLNLLEGSEERCLSLSVYTPAPSADARLPVMVWLPGGGFIEGDQYGGGEYNGTHLAIKGNVVVVSIQYRVGSLGWLYQPAAGIAGNMGLLDQRLGMQWVVREIARFGGDPSRITLFGESAGAISVCAHITARASKGLFHSAIMESGVCDSSAFLQPPDRAEAIAAELIESVDCNHTSALTCMQRLSVDKACAPLVFPRSRSRSSRTLPKLAPVIGWTPVLDGDIIAQWPLEAIKRQSPPTVPIMVGTNKNEGSVFLLLLPLIVPGVRLPLSESGLRSVVSHFFNTSSAATIVDYYSKMRFDSNNAIAEAITTDFFWYCSNRRIVEAASRHTPAFQYFFDYPVAGLVGRIFGDYHGSEMPFVWDWQKSPFTKEQTKLSDDVMNFWLAFAKSGGNPNPASGMPLHWPQFNTSTNGQAVLNFNASRTVLFGGFQTNRCDFWGHYYD